MTTAFCSISSGNHDEEASIGFQGDVMMGLQLESGGEEGSRGIGEEFQDGSLEGEDEVSGEHAGVGESERFFGPECKDGSSGPKLGLEELGRGKEGQENKMGQDRVESGYGLVNIYPGKGMEADENVNTSRNSGDGPDGPRIANGTEWAACGGSDQGMYSERKGQSNSGGDRGISRIKKARKMKKLILVQKDDFFGEMESEADRMVIAQESRRARKRVMRKKRRKPRLQAALESASEADKSQAETSRESNYFVDCRTKSGPAGVEDGMEAIQFWEMGKKLGVSARSGEGEITEKLVEMERRDREEGSKQAPQREVDGGLGSENYRLDEDIIV